MIADGIIKIKPHGGGIIEVQTSDGVVRVFKVPKPSDRDKNHTLRDIAFQEIRVHIYIQC
jgi:hypothetical protein